MRLKEAKNSIDTTNLNILPIRYYDDTADAFVLEDGSYYDLLEKTAEDIDNMLADDCQYQMMKFAKFLKLAKDDFTVISLNYQTDLLPQKKAFLRLLENSNGNTRTEWLKRSLHELELAESCTKKKEYYFAYHAKDIEDLSEKRKSVNVLNDGIRHIDKSKKIKIVYQLCNMNSQVPMEVI